MSFSLDPETLRAVLGRSFDLLCLLEGFEPLAGADRWEEAAPGLLDRLGPVRPQNNDELRMAAYARIADRVAEECLWKASRVKRTATSMAMLDHAGVVACEFLEKVRKGNFEVRSLKELRGYLAGNLRWKDGDVRKAEKRGAKSMGDLDSIAGDSKPSADVPASSDSPDPASAREFAAALALLERFIAVHGGEGAGEETVVARVANELVGYIRFANCAAADRPQLPKCNVKPLFEVAAMQRGLLSARAWWSTQTATIRSSTAWRRVSEFDIGGVDGFAVWYAGRLLESEEPYEAHARHLKRFREALDELLEGERAPLAGWLVRAIVDGETPLLGYGKAADHRLPRGARRRGLKREPLIRALFTIERAETASLACLQPPDQLLALAVRSARGPSNRHARRFPLEVIAELRGTSFDHLVERVSTVAEMLEDACEGDAWIMRLAERMQSGGREPFDGASLSTALWWIAAAGERAFARLDQPLQDRVCSVRDWLADRVSGPCPVDLAAATEAGVALHVADAWQGCCELSRALLTGESFVSAEPGEEARVTLAALWTIQTASARSMSSLDDPGRALVDLIRGGSRESLPLLSNCDRTAMIRLRLQQVCIAPGGGREATERAKKVIDAALDGCVQEIARKIQSAAKAS
ncbi:MAG: hypothetical protein HZB39_12875 [Planctomycetes bacterium]|nr:hypothetical protein [Planctomycetota bacterium]